MKIILTQKTQKQLQFIISVVILITNNTKLVHYFNPNPQYVDCLRLLELISRDYSKNTANKN